MRGKLSHKGANVLSAIIVVLGSLAAAALMDDTFLPARIRSALGLSVPAASSGE